MLITELFEQTPIVPHGHYTLRTDPDAPNVLRLINTDTRELVGIVKSAADFLRLASPRTLRGADIEIKVPGAVYSSNQQIIKPIERILPILQRDQNRKFTLINLAGKLDEVTAAELEKPHLYLDMDGVQADFFSAWARWHAEKFGQSHVERYKDIGSREQREQSISELSSQGPAFIEKFFANLPPLPGGQRLIQWLRQNRVPFTVLSAPLRGMEQPSIAGKRAWLDHHNPGSKQSAIFTGDKARMASTNGRPNVLVDDFKKYVNAWTEAGGIGILYRDANVDAVIQQLAKIYKTPQDVPETKAEDIRTFKVKIKLSQPGYSQMLDTSVQARTPEMARRLVRQQYGGRNVLVGQPRLVK